MLTLSARKSSFTSEIYSEKHVHNAKNQIFPSLYNLDYIGPVEIQNGIITPSAIDHNEQIVFNSSDAIFVNLDSPLVTFELQNDSSQNGVPAGYQLTNPISICQRQSQLLTSEECSTLNTIPKFPELVQEEFYSTKTNDAQSRSYEAEKRDEDIRVIARQLSLESVDSPFVNDSNNAMTNQCSLDLSATENIRNNNYMIHNTSTPEECNILIASGKHRLANKSPTNRQMCSPVSQPHSPLDCNTFYNEHGSLSEYDTKEYPHIEEANSDLHRHNIPVDRISGLNINCDSANGELSPLLGAELENLNSQDSVPFTWQVSSPNVMDTALDTTDGTSMFFPKVPDSISFMSPVSSVRSEDFCYSAPHSPQILFPTTLPSFSPEPSPEAPLKNIPESVSHLEFVITGMQ